MMKKSFFRLYISTSKQTEKYCCKKALFRAFINVKLELVKLMKLNVGYPRLIIWNGVRKCGSLQFCMGWDLCYNEVFCCFSCVSVSVRSHLHNRHYRQIHPDIQREQKFELMAPLYDEGMDFSSGNRL